MKKTQLFTSIILAIIMIIAPQTFALASDDMAKSGSASSLIADSFSLDKNTTHLSLHTKSKTQVLILKILICAFQAAKLSR